MEQLPETKPQTWQDHIIDIFPENIIKSIYEGNVLPIVYSQCHIWYCTGYAERKKRSAMLSVCESLAETMFKFTNIIMYFAPFGVGAAIAVTVGHLGIDILKNLALLLITLYMALIAFFLLVLLPVALFIKITDKKIYTGNQGTGIYCICYHQF